MAIPESAGGVIVNCDGQIVIVTQRDGSWSLPKGHVEAGETIFEAALREVYEESGIRDLTLVAQLDHHDRPARFEDGAMKRVHLFLFTTAQERLMPQDPHNTTAVWVSPLEATRRIRNSGDAERVRELMPLIAQTARTLNGGVGGRTL